MLQISYLIAKANPRAFDSGAGSRRLPNAEAIVEWIRDELEQDRLVIITSIEESR